MPARRLVLVARSEPLMLTDAGRKFFEKTQPQDPLADKVLQASTEAELREAIYKLAEAKESEGNS
jgi:hypothetical protein